MSADFEGAKRYALQRLAELPPVLTYHSIAHTRDDVVPAAEQLAALEGFGDEEIMLVATAAWFHDLGYLERHDHNEVIAVEMVQVILPTLHYSPSQIQVICEVIMATQMPQTPRTPLSAIIADADLSMLGSPHFLDYEKALRQEFAAFGSVYDDAGWYAYQLGFLQQHQYFTASAHRLYDDQKQQNMTIIANLLAQAQG